MDRKGQSSRVRRLTRKGLLGACYTRAVLEPVRDNRPRLVIWVAICALIVAVGILIVSPGAGTDPRVCDALARADLRTVVVTPQAKLVCEGVRVVTDPSVSALLAGIDGKALASKLRAMRATGVAVLPGQDAPGLAGRLSKLQHVVGLRSVALSPELVVAMAAPEIELSERDREAVAYVARALFRGAREPNTSSFPSSLRRVQRVEVMVALSDRGEPRLWRSARGTSIARAVLTAARVARERWRERESAMGGPLLERLRGLDVEVSLLEEDGTLAHSTANFVDRAITRQHGVGFDYRSDWHYSLPNDVIRQGKGSAFRALSALSAERGLPASVLTEPGVRLYRFVPVALATSRAESSPSGGNSD